MKTYAPQLRGVVLENLLSIAAAEVGYLEKISNSQLDDKTANAGYNNWTKYGAWYGLYMVRTLIGVTCLSRTAQTRRASAQALSRIQHPAPQDGTFLQTRGYCGCTPKRGDIVYFTTSGYPNGSGNVGLVYKVANDYVYIIEGNTSSGTAVIDNGGAVA